MNRFTSSSPRLSRRTFLSASVAASLAFPMRSWSQEPSWKIGQSTALSGPLGSLGQEMHHGAKVCFDQVNAKGGVHGRPIQLVVADDGYDTKRAVANVRTFMDDKSTFALFNCMGTPMIEAVLPSVIDAGIPFFAPFSGALSIRPKTARNVFPIRVSYPDEAEQLVQHLHTIGIRRIGVVYQNNAFGKEIYEGAKQAIAKHGMPEAPTATVENSGADADAAAVKISAHNLDAVLIAMAGKPAVNFVHAIRAKRRGLALYGLSVLSSSSVVKDMGDNGVGIAISQVMPSPSASVMPVVRDFKDAWKKSNTELVASYLALEGYINARVFVEALRKAGPRTTWSTFIESTWNLKRLDLGGFDVSFTEPGRSGSKFIELTMLASGGKFVR